MVINVHEPGNYEALFTPTHCSEIWSVLLKVFYDGSDE